MFVLIFPATTATALEHLGTTITSDFDGTPPLYITKTRKNNQEYIYVNNALILHSRSNIQMVNEMGKKQVTSNFQFGLIWLSIIVFFFKFRALVVLCQKI